MFTIMQLLVAEQKRHTFRKCTYSNNTMSTSSNTFFGEMWDFFDFNNQRNNEFHKYDRLISINMNFCCWLKKNNARLEKVAQSTSHRSPRCQAVLTKRGFFQMLSENKFWQNLSFVRIWVLSEFEFLSFVTVWDFEFTCHLNLWVLPAFDFF